MTFHQTNHLCKLGNSGSRIEPCGSPALNFFPFRPTLWNLFDRKLLISFNKSLGTPKDLNLNIEPGKPVLSNALDISKNTARVSFGGSQSKLEKNYGL